MNKKTECSVILNAVFFFLLFFFLQTLPLTHLSRLPVWSSISLSRWLQCSSRVSPRTRMSKMQAWLKLSAGYFSHWLVSVKRLYFDEHVFFFLSGWICSLQYFYMSAICCWFFCMIYMTFVSVQDDWLAVLAFGSACWHVGYRSVERIGCGSEVHHPHRCHSTQNWTGLWCESLIFGSLWTLRGGGRV